MSSPRKEKKQTGILFPEVKTATARSRRPTPSRHTTQPELWTSPASTSPRLQTGTVTPVQDIMEAMRDEVHAMFAEFQQRFLETQSLTARYREQSPNTEHRWSTSHDEQPEGDLPWDLLLEELPTAPPLAEDSWGKVYKLAREVRRHDWRVRSTWYSQSFTAF
jgi:hypothetical protein